MLLLTVIVPFVDYRDKDRLQPATTIGVTPRQIIIVIIARIVKETTNSGFGPYRFHPSHLGFGPIHCFF